MPNYSYKMRIKTIDDVALIWVNLPVSALTIVAKEPWKTLRNHILVEFTCNIDLGNLRTMLSRIEGTAVMLLSLNYAQSYDGQLRYER